MANTPNKTERERKEMLTLFANPKTAREAWRNVGAAILQNPATMRPATVDKYGEPDLNSLIEQYSYNKLKKDIDTLADKDREPTELEMIIACQAVKARTDTQAAIFIRDIMGAKPIDESKIDANVSANQYEQLTDEELELLAAHRAQKAEQEQLDDQTDTSSPTSDATLHLVEGGEQNE